jgi:hypothetical protein|tara:strand:+ start:818 stop:1282 length:465 start_codon:yes stop_codon:yes gene_type:complete
MLFLNKYINKVLIFGLIIIVFYNIFSIFILLFSSKIDGHLSKSFNYLPYKYSIYFQSPLRYSKRTLQTNSDESKRLFNILKTTEKKSALDYSYWNNKLLYQVSQKTSLINFEKNFQNAVILSKNNLDLKKTLKIFYLRNIYRFNSETKKIVLSN